MKMGKLIDIAGQRFGRLIATRPVMLGTGHSKWLCVCDCGKLTEVRSNHLRTGAIQSCGCFQREATSAATSSHRMTRTPTYVAWQGMKARCQNARRKDWHLYGGRGIKVCERWEDFALFLEDMGERPPGMTLDRVDANGNYTPDNCRWATPSDQARNRRCNVVIEHQGQRRTMAEWCELKGIAQSTLWNRLNRLGWPVERALS